MAGIYDYLRRMTHQAEGTGGNDMLGQLQGMGHAQGGNQGFQPGMAPPAMAPQPTGVAKYLARIGFGPNPEQVQQQQTAWAGAQPGHVQMGGEQIGIPRQPWGFGAEQEAVAESPGVQQALGQMDKPDKKPIDWAGIAAVIGQQRQQAQSGGVSPMPIAGGRGRRGPGADALEGPALLMQYGQPIPRRIV